MTAQTTTASEKKKVVTVTNPSIDAKVQEKLVTARIGLLLKAPFFGNLATRLVLKNADEWLTTAATDGRNFYYNSEFVNKLSVKETEFLFGHETLHNVYDHMGRRGDRDPKLFNIAADYCVNADLIEQRIGEKITTVPILYDAKYNGMSSEEVYDDLYKNAKKYNLQDLIDKMLDEHMDDDSEGAGEDGDGDEEGNGRPKKLTAEEKKQIRDEMAEAIISAAQTVSEKNLPGNVRRMIKDITEPKMNWRDILHQKFKSTIKADFTWMRQSRKSWHLDAILPGQNNANRIEVAISIDSSGSMQPKMLQDFLSEVRGITEEFDDYKIYLWCIDTQVYNYKVFTPDNVCELADYEIMGNGGNTFEENWNFMREQDLTPELFLLFTDGYPCPNWCGPEDETYCDTLWLLHGTTTIVPPFGETCYYTE